MKSKPEISEQEIRAFMNFDQLLKSHENLVINKSKETLWKKIIIVSLAVIAISTVWFIYIGDQKSLQPPDPSNTQNVYQYSPDSLSGTTDSSISIKESPTTEPAASIPLSKDIKVKPSTDNLTHKKTDSDDSLNAEDSSIEYKYTEASPVDGYPALYEYFKRELIYPQEGLRDSIQGIVTVSFVINEAGVAEKIKIENSLGEAFDRETIKVIENMPLWKPAMVNNKPVQSKLAMPMTFQIQKIRSKD